MIRPLFALGSILLVLIVGGSMARAQVTPGSKPPLPIGYHKWKQLQSDLAARARLGADLPPVGSPHGPAAKQKQLSKPDSSMPSAFSPEGFLVGSYQTIAGPPGSPNLSNPLVLTDGSVIAHVSCTGIWWKLTPNVSGSYASGTWTQISTMPAGHEPRFFASAVLPDGRVIVMGGQYNGPGCPDAWTNKGSIYDPIANTWANVTPPAGWAQIGDSQATVLANGTYFQANCCDAPGNKAALLNAGTLTWTATGTGKADYYNEEGFTLLPNGKVLTVNAYVGTGTCGRNTELYDPTTGTWSSAGNTPDILADCDAANAEGGSPTFKMGPQVMMYNGKVLAAGANTANVAHSAIYDTATALWSPAANLPQTCGASANLFCTIPDGPGVILPNGKVLLAMSAGAFHTPTTYFEYDPPTNTFSTVATDATITSFQVNFTILPTGQILEVDTDVNGVYLYNPGGSSTADLRPVISSTPNCVSPNGTYVASGTQFNGLSEGVNYGNDQMSGTNYPIIRIVNGTTGHVFYARTFNHSSRSIAPNAPVSTSFKVAAATEIGASTLFVIANGISSVGKSITVSAACPSITTATHDFNGDLNSDILWRHNSGAVATWLVNGVSVTDSSAVGSASPDWQIVGQRDFDGDGKHDILWRNSASGEVVMWLMNAHTVTQSAVVGGATTDWQIAATADFNGDGKGDILWRNGRGVVHMWLQNGASVTQSSTVGSASFDWQIAGTGDFNGDGKADILWRNFTNHATIIWFMNSATVTSTSQGVGGFSGIPSDWQIVAIGDFNGDGKSDLLLRQNGGAVAVWLLNGATVTQAAGVGAATTDWMITESGDFDGDGKSDILWRNTTSGAVAVWLLNGATVTQSAGIGVATTDWVIQNVNAN